MAEKWVFPIRAGINESKTDFKVGVSVLTNTLEEVLWVHTHLRIPFCGNYMYPPYFWNSLSYMLFLGMLRIPLPSNYLFLFLRRTDDKNTYYQRR